jgi:hypothetical protein
MGLRTLGLVFLLLPVGCGGTIGANDGTHTDAGVAPHHDAGADGNAPGDSGPDTSDTAPDAPMPRGPGALLFAGYGEAPLDDTWLWNGASWAELLPGGGEDAPPQPSVRDDQSMIGYEGKVLLFGGDGLSSELADTWVWDGGWTEQKVSGPSAREGAAVGVLNGKVILFGGMGDGGAFLADTWQWDGSTWTELKVTGPTNRTGASMATLGNTLVLFGSLFDTNTWLFDGTSWTQSTAPGPTGDPAGPSGSRSFQTMATLGDKVVLFGGEQDANHILNDTWTWDGTAWTKVSVSSPPPSRFHAAMTTFQGKILLYGGAGAIPSGAPFLGDTWTWDGTSWTEVTTTGPSARYGYTMGVWQSP